MRLTCISGSHTAIDSVKKAEVHKALCISLAYSESVHSKSYHTVCPHILHGSVAVILVCIFHIFNDVRCDGNGFFKIAHIITDKERYLLCHIRYGSISLASVDRSGIIV